MELEWKESADVVEWCRRGQGGRVKRGLGTLWRSTGLSGPEHLEGYDTTPLHWSKPSWKQQARLTQLWGIWCLVFCVVGGVECEIGKRRFGFDSRIEKQEGQGFCVTCNVPHGSCVSSSLAHHPLILWEDRFTFFSLFSFCLGDQPIVFLYRPWCQGVSWPRICTEEFPIKQKVCSLQHPVYYSSKEDFQQVCEGERISESIVCKCSPVPTTGSLTFLRLFGK